MSFQEPVQEHPGQNLVRSVPHTFCLAQNAAAGSNGQPPLTYKKCLKLARQVLTAEGYSQPLHHGCPKSDEPDVPHQLHPGRMSLSARSVTGALT